MANSGATVKVYRGASDVPINTFTVDKNSVGYYWNVFKLTINADQSIVVEKIDTYDNTFAKS